MGVYMSTPVTEKVSEDEKCERFTYGASSMQGWRTSQEDAHNCLPEFDSETKTSLFAVYDGHGGAEVAKYCSTKLPDFIRRIEKYKTNELSVCLQEAFIGFDEVLTQDNVIKELKVLAGDDEGDDEEEETDAIAVRKEADILCQEANMPIEELRAKYSGNPLLQQNEHLKSQKQPSPMIKAKRSKAMTGNGATEDTIKEQLDLKEESEHPDNDNNLNTEKELKETSSQNDTKVDKTNSEPSKSDLNEENSEAAVSSTSECNDAAAGKSVGSKDDSEVSSEAVSTSSKDNESKATNEAASSSSSGCSSGTSTSVSSSSGSSGISSEAGSSSSGSGEVASSSGVAGSSQAGCSSSGVECGSGEPGSSGVSGGSVKKSGLTLADLDGDDLDSDDSDTTDEDEEYNSDDYEDIEDEEEEEEEEGGSGLFKYVNQCADQPDEEPGSDSGCTAVLALLRDKQLFVANAGDSRCVLCRDGKAVDLSFDHKPEDKEEKDRIEAAGGQVTEDGRVNGGLNLSRALGDHYYKRNETKEAKDQMISAFPDVECTTIGDKDEFLVLACDGIWNSMTSQECIDFVREQLKDEEKVKKPSLICEEMFDHCLAPNTSGDGTGCDNMTCIIVVFNQKDSVDTKHDLDSSGSGEPPEKRQRTDEEAVS